MSDLTEAISRLEAALERIGHPLAEPSNRPPGRPREQTQRIANDLLGTNLPEELIELWEWWQEDTDPPSAVLPPFARYLPGGIRILGLEEAVAVAHQRQVDEMTSPETQAWLPVLYQGDRVVLHWCEIPNSYNGQVPVTVADRMEVPDEEPVWRSENIATLISSIAQLGEEDLWVNRDDLGWQYTGEYGRFPWLC